MRLEEAIKIFEIGKRFTKEELKKRYIMLSKANHPDLGGSKSDMQRINEAYELLKEITINSEDLSYYNTLLNKLLTYKSNTIYNTDTMEYKYALRVNNLISSFAYSSENKDTLDFNFKNILVQIRNVFNDYLMEVSKNIPSIYKLKFKTIENECSFDKYVLNVKKVLNEYKMINDSLSDAINSIDLSVDINILEEILKIKEDVFKEIVLNKIDLNTACGKLRTLAITLIMQRMNFDKKINETYKAILEKFYKRMMELDFKESDDIKSTINLLSSVLNKLKSLDGHLDKSSDLDELCNIDFENKMNVLDKGIEQIYISVSNKSNPYEFVIRKGENEKFVYFDRKDKNGNVKVYVRGKKGFYENYMKLSEFLDKANYLFVKSNGGVLIYMYEDVGIYVGRDASIYVDKINYEWYSVNFKSDRYEDKSKLMFDIYESFYKEKVYKENEKTKSR